MEKPKRRQSLPQVGPSSVLCAVLLLGTCLLAQETRVLDRIVAIVEGTVVTQSQLEAALHRTSLTDRPLIDKKAVTEADRLDQLIEQILIRREIESFPGLDLKPADVEQQVALLEKRYAGEGGLEAMAGRWQLSPSEIEAEIRYQLKVKKFLDIRFYSFVSIEDAAIEDYYRETLPPLLMKAGQQQVPPLDAVREQIRSTLVEQQVQRELERWLQDLKDKADISLIPSGLRFVPAAADRTYDLHSSSAAPGQRNTPGGRP